MNHTHRSSDLFSRVLGFAGATLILTLSACGGSSDELAQGEATATVRGALGQLDGDPAMSSEMRAILVWTFWDDADCVTHAGRSPEERSCSGSLIATEAAVVDEGGRFALSVSEPPPAFVHGYDVAIAEAFVAIVPSDADLETADFTDPSQRIGLSDYVVLYAPADFAEDTVEAALVGSALGAGFHLVLPIEDGPQFEVTLDDGTEVISSQRGVLVPTGFDTEIVVTPGAELSPWLGL